MPRNVNKAQRLIRIISIAVVAVHDNSIHVFCGRLFAAGICVFWGASSLGTVGESPSTH